ncbi:MAG: response regulator [Armatimonadota bacterium]|nr:response regulator [Armatimonadota bacterium]
MAFKVLVVEDDLDVQEALQCILELEGYTVIVANNGLEALHRVEAEPPGLILLDLMMPVMDGFGFTEEMRRREGSCRIPIMVVTAYGNTAELASRLGQVKFIHKPFDVVALLHEVARFAGN